MSGFAAQAESQRLTGETGARTPHADLSEIVEETDLRNASARVIEELSVIRGIAGQAEPFVRAGQAVVRANLATAGQGRNVGPRGAGRSALLFKGEDATYLASHAEVRRHTKGAFDWALGANRKKVFEEFVGGNAAESSRSEDSVVSGEAAVGTFSFTVALETVIRTFLTSVR